MGKRSLTDILTMTLYRTESYTMFKNLTLQINFKTSVLSNQIAAHWEKKERWSLQGNGERQIGRL